MSLNAYAKAIIAGLAAGVGTANTLGPMNAKQWYEVVGYAVVTALLTAFIPNTEAGAVVSPSKLLPPVPSSGVTIVPAGSQQVTPGDPGPTPGAHFGGNYTG